MDYQTLAKTIPETISQQLYHQEQQYMSPGLQEVA
jgi:hypothetical protein